jgi:hypothetical protein
VALGAVVDLIQGVCETPHEGKRRLGRHRVRERVDGQCGACSDEKRGASVELTALGKAERESGGQETTTREQIRIAEPDFSGYVSGCGPCRVALNGRQIGQSVEELEIRMSLHARPLNHS